METKFKEGDKVIVLIHPRSEEKEKNKRFDGKIGTIVGHYVIHNKIYNQVRFDKPVTYALQESGFVDEDINWQKD